jgi:hypothetical protein
VLSPASLAATLSLSPPGTLSLGRTLTATLNVSNSGGSGANVTVTYGETESNPLMLGSPVPVPPAGPLLVAGGGSRTVAWSYLAGNCGTGSIDVTAAGTDAATGGIVPSAQASSLVSVTGNPASVKLTAGSARAPAGGLASLSVEVMDDCAPVAGAVRDAAVSLIVVKGGGSVIPSSGLTDPGGKLAATLRLGDDAGINEVRAAVTGGSNPSATVTVDGVTDSKPEAYLTTNSFNPDRNERVQVRVMVPSATKVRIRIFNVAGELVRGLDDTDVGQPGLTRRYWDGRNDQGHVVGNGMYLMQIVMGKEVQTRRVIVLKR